MVFQSPAGETEVKEGHDSRKEITDAVGHIDIYYVKSDLEGYHNIYIADDDLGNYRNDQWESDITGATAYTVINVRPADEYRAEYRISDHFHAVTDDFRVLVEHAYQFLGKDETQPG